jgi:cellobiose phosphorylase
MYRVGMESILGITLRRGALRIDPCIPRDWPHYEVRFKAPHAEYHIVVENPARVNRGVQRLEMDGVVCPGQEITIVNDGAVHMVRVVLGTTPL